MMLNWDNILAAGLYGIGGMTVYMVLFSRRLLHMCDGNAKRWVLLSFLAALVLAPVVGGYYLGLSAWLGAPIAIVIILLLNEIRDAMLGRQCAAPAPVESSNTHISLVKPFTTFDLAERRYEIRNEKWQFDRFRVVLMSDLHVNDLFPISYYKAALRRAVAAEPDVIFMAGDFVSEHHWIPLLPGILAKMKAKCGTFAVLGNHDHWVGGDDVARTLRECGLILLSGETAKVPISSDHNAIICGYDAPWGCKDYRLPQKTNGDLLLALTHTPDNIYDLSEAGADAVFAGHFHGGQGRLPFIGPLVIPSKYGRRFCHGHFKLDDTHLFVTSGLGASSPPLRVYCKPEIITVDFLGRGM